MDTYLRKINHQNSRTEEKRTKVLMTRTKRKEVTEAPPDVYQTKRLQEGLREIC